MPPVQIVVDPAVRPSLPPRSLSDLQHALRRLVRRAGGIGSSVAVVICGDAAMRSLHAAHFGEAKATDVLSFPAGPPIPGLDDEGALGEIVLNADAIRRQAPGLGAGAWTHEARSLCIHAVAHLIGHDHDRSAAARRMLRCERRLARTLRQRVDRPYGGRR